MRRIHHVGDWTEPDPRRDERSEEQRGADRQTESLAGLAMALAIVVVCLFLVRALEAKSALEDCLMAGRRTCDTMLVQAP